MVRKFTQALLVALILATPLACAREGSEAETGTQPTEPTQPTQPVAPITPDTTMMDTTMGDTTGAL